MRSDPIKIIVIGGELVCNAPPPLSQDKLTYRLLTAETRSKKRLHEDYVNGELIKTVFSGHSILKMNTTKMFVNG